MEVGGGLPYGEDRGFMGGNNETGSRLLFCVSAEGNRGGWERKGGGEVWIGYVQTEIMILKTRQRLVRKSESGYSGRWVGVKPERNEGKTHQPTTIQK